MQIIIEDACLTWDLEGKNLLLQQVVDEVEEFLFTVGRVPVGLIIDGHSLTQEELEEQQEEKIKGDEVFEFEVIGVTEFVLQNMEGADEANNKLIENIKTFANELYCSSKTIDPREVIEEIKHFYFFWIRLQNLIPEAFKGVDFGGKEFSEIIVEIQKIFKEIVDAMEEEDCVLVADLLQYEVVPFIETISQSISMLKENISKQTTKKDDEIVKEFEKQKSCDGE